MSGDMRALLDALPPELREEIAGAITRGLQGLAAPAPMRLSQWAEAHFYLSAESSYSEGKWQCYPFQRAILDCIGHDQVREVTVRKSARVGYTKMVLAGVGYFAEHKRRNQVLYQPTDDDADDFCTTEVDTMLRDVRVMQRVFPSFLRRSKDNTLRKKKFLGSLLHLRGGKAAKNYRRLTVDVVWLDELDGFDRDIEKEGSPTKLSAKRLEGAVFPKHVKGSTPKLQGFSLTDEEFDRAELRFNFEVPCPHCGDYHALTWGGKEARHGFKWRGSDPETVAHLCPHCGALYSQAEYLEVWQRGRWVAQDGTWIDDDASLPQIVFRRLDGTEREPPASVGFFVWTAYSPQASWSAIVTEFLAAAVLAKTGDHTAMKTFTNTTLGQSYALEGAKTDAELLQKRAEKYPLRLVPRGGLVLVAGVDTQDNRLEVVVWAIGRGEEMWVVDYRVLYGDPGQPRLWQELDVYLATRWPHEGGQRLAIDAVAIDTQGHFTHQVYAYAMHREHRRIHAIRGDNRAGQPIVSGAPKRQDVNDRGTIVKSGVKLWHVGTDTAKDLLWGRLQVGQPGPGYVHMSRELPREFFEGLAAEQRVVQRTSRGEEHRWVKVKADARNEPLDCTVYAMFGAARMKLHQYTDAEWSRLEEVLCPPTADLFGAAALPVPEPLPPIETTQPEPAAGDAGPALQVPPALLPIAQPRGRRVRGAYA